MNGAANPADHVLVTVAVPRPIDSLFTYLAPREWQPRLQPGVWVKAPFGKASIQGFIAEETKELSELPAGLKVENLKSLVEAGDPANRIPAEVMELCRWASRYYATPLGEVLQAACPAAALGLKSAKREAREIETGSLMPAPKLNLNTAQTEAVTLLDALRTSDAPGKAALLHGVTGSGKTEVYIELAQRALRDGKGVILLVPEIALTSQLHERLQSGLGEFVARWHSAMPDGVRRDQMAALQSGQVRVVVGARSAIFAPVRNLGLILVDEEHDGTYKQEDRVRYHARDLAIVRGRMTDALVVLGSATPSLETLERVREGKYRLATLPERYSASGMPTVEIVDLAENPLIEGIQAPLAEKTLAAIKETVAQGNQVMVFLNRRGFAAFLLCEDCGEVCECPNCSISLTYHKRDRDLRCHVCGHVEKTPDFCPKCQNDKLQPMGAGTESLEEELPKLLPELKILRLDRDVVTSASRLEKTLEAFRRGDAQVLLGTQMLVKGHDFPKVTLVVIVLADALFRFPDFRAPERALQVLTQVAGRAGRGADPGRVLVQTFQPDHPVLEVLQAKKTAAEFLEGERELREALHYPPFGRMARLRLESTEKSEAQERSQVLGGLLQTLVPESDPDALQILGPSEAFLERAKGIYRWDILLKSKEIALLQKAVLSAKVQAQKSKWSLLVDIDPYGLG